MAAPAWNTVIPAFILLGSTTLAEGANFSQYPPPMVSVAQGDDVLLSFLIDGRTDRDAIVIQGPNPITGSNKFVPVYELGAGEEDPHEPFKGNFSVNIAWFDGITVVNLTILDFQHGEAGLYKLSVGFHTGPDINVTIVADLPVINTTSILETKTGNTMVPTGSTSPGGRLPGWAVALIVLATFAVLTAVAIVIYKWRTSGTRRENQERYTAVKKEAHDNVDTRQDAEANVIEMNGIGGPSCNGPSHA
ncbi:uncharacterized protein LOC144879785 [Branchiostoma floridae x Branchiostoma japonicum]